MAKVLLLYFSQTGSTQKLCEIVAAELSTAGHTVTTADIGDSLEADNESFDVIGIGSPTFFYRLPSNVSDFIRRLPPLTGKDAFYLLSYGTAIGGAERQLYRLLKRKGARIKGFEASSGRDYWYGYIQRGILFAPNGPRKDEVERMKEFAGALSARLGTRDAVAVPERRKLGIIHRLERFAVNRVLINFVYSLFFHAKDKLCTGCGRCVRECPVQNIYMDGSKPSWGRNCLFCLRCAVICPEEAVRSPMDWSVFAPFMHYNIWYAKRRGVPFDNITFTGGNITKK